MTAELDHVHAWGPMELARWTGTPHRRCTADGCAFVNLDGPGDDDLAPEQTR
ncbi:MAG: hypothetical protein ABIV94_02630 [Acidimicrobiales bacterium]